MALSETDLQDILSGLTPEEQKQLFERLGKTFGNDGGTTPEPQPRPHKNVKDGSSKVYCCIYCGSASYKGHGTNSKGGQRYICKDCGRTWSENYGDSLRYTHLDEDTWRAMLQGFVDELSIPKIAKNCGLSTKTVWLAKTKVNQAIMTMYGYTVNTDDLEHSARSFRADLPLV